MDSVDSLLNPHLPPSSSQALHMHNPVRQIRMLADDVMEAPVGGDDGILLLNREGGVEAVVSRVTKVDRQARSGGGELRIE
jgi:hypothetical protein